MRTRYPTNVLRMLILVAFVSSPFIPTASAQQSATYEGKAAYPNFPSIGEKWMSKINPGRSLAELAIPGSHDAGALHCLETKGPDADNLTGMNGFFKREPLVAKTCCVCQSMSIAEQLKAGIRCLDIRLRAQNDGKLGLYHGIYYQYASLLTVVAECETYLKAQPTECIIMRVQIEGTADDGAPDAKTTFKKFIGSRQHLFYIENKIPTLAEQEAKS